MEKWISFYERFFATREAAAEFVGELEGITDRSNPRHRAKIMMHQTQRLISIADDIIEIRRGKEALQLLFVLICAENIAKLFHDFEDDGQSRSFVRRFFSEFIVGDDRTTLKRGFLTHDGEQLDLKAIADNLYSVRCDVVHEGQYWGFTFYDRDTSNLNTAPDVVVNVSFAEFRDVVVRGCIRAIQGYVAP